MLFGRRSKNTVLKSSYCAETLSVSAMSYSIKAVAKEILTKHPRHVLDPGKLLRFFLTARGVLSVRWSSISSIPRTLLTM